MGKGKNKTRPFAYGVWVPFSPTTLPPFSDTGCTETVLVYVEAGFFHTGSFREVDEGILCLSEDHGYELLGVKFWMPIPCLPKRC